MIFNKKEINAPIGDNSYVVINKKEVDKVLRHNDYKKFIQIFQNIPLGSVLFAISEKNRLAHLVRKQDLKFIDAVFDFFDTNKDANYHAFNSLYVKSTDKEFFFKTQENQIEAKFKTKSTNARDVEILKFKRTVLAKVFHYKENADPNFINQSLDMLKKHNLIDNFMIRKLSSITLTSNFEDNHNQVIKHNLFKNKIFRKEYLSYVFQASTNTENLNILMKNFEEDIRKIFFEKKDSNDFWFDFKLTKGKPEEGIPACYSVRPWNENTKKLLWLEKNSMGFSNVETPYYIEFLKFFNFEELEGFLQKVDKNKYLDMFDKSIKEYDLLPNEILNPPYSAKLDIKHILLREIKHKEWDSPQNFYEIIKRGILKSELEQTLEVKTIIKKTNKI